MKTMETMKDVYNKMTEIAEERDRYKQLFFDSVIENNEDASKVFVEKYKSLDYMFSYLSKLKVEYDETKI